MKVLHRLKKFVAYQWRSKTKYYLHSPFVYNFYLNVLEGAADPQLDKLNQLREKLRTDHSLIPISDLGTGSTPATTVSNIEKNVAIAPKYGELLYRLVRYTQPKQIIEIGTSIGISAAYIAMAAPDAKVLTLEGSVSLVQQAGANLAQLGISNVQIIEGDFSETLAIVLEKCPNPDMIFFDGNHTLKDTLAYFELCLTTATERSIFVFDDINWSEEMTEAWNQIKAHPRVTLTIDIYRMGICFFRKEKLAKEDFVLRY